MALTAGTRIAQYEIVGSLGAGGMGEVYRARDTRLDREVAIKVVPAAVAADPDRVARFEREARAVAALSHPGILAIHDFGSSDGVTYAVMELLEGSTLRERLEAGALPVRRAIDIAVQVARALAAAHDKGIVHRDIKPENIFIAPDGHVRILDFGLARVVDRDTPAALAATRTRMQTSDGAVLGTVGYMSPEQVRGAPADHRSDIFSFGIVLHEMLTGRAPFAGDSAVEIMNAILKEDPPPIAASDPPWPALARVVEHCLEKEPAERFQSARDLAFNLEALRGSSASVSRPAVSPAASRRPRLAVAIVAIAALIAGLFGGRLLWGSRQSSTTSAPQFTRLTYENGTIWNGRFTADGQSLVYGAAWNGEPIRTWLSRSDAPGSTRLELPDALLLSISSKGELAVSLGHSFEGWMGEGTLARVPLLGGAPRPIAEHVREADWTPDASDLAIVRRVEGRERLEFPIGKMLYETSGYISHPRFSRDGQRIAFADHPLYADDNGHVSIVDREGHQTVLTPELHALRGLSWSPDGGEIWFTARSSPFVGTSLQAVSLERRTRTLLSLPTDWRILDVLTDGRVLFGTETGFRHTEVVREGTIPKDLSIFEQSLGTALAQDGRAALITDQGSTAGSSYSTYVRYFDRPSAVRLGDGQGIEFMPDGRSVLSVVYGPPSRVLLLPLGTGQPRELPNPDGFTVQNAAAVADGRRIVFAGAHGSASLRGYVQDTETGAIHSFTPEGIVPPGFSWHLPPNGQTVTFLDKAGGWYLLPLKGGAPQPLPGIGPGEYVSGWSADSRAIYVSRLSGAPNRIFRIDVATGRRTFLREVNPSQRAGVRLSEVFLTPDGSTILHSYSRLLSNLYVMHGLSPAPD
jgi:serine/threonine protein kinase